MIIIVMWVKREKNFAQTVLGCRQNGNQLFGESPRITTIIIIIMMNFNLPPQKRVTSAKLSDLK